MIDAALVVYMTIIDFVQGLARNYLVDFAFRVDFKYKLNGFLLQFIKL